MPTIRVTFFVMIGRVDLEVYALRGGATSQMASSHPRSINIGPANVAKNVSNFSGF